MGSVYLAEDLHLARRVAIKFLTSTDHHYRARFIREARAVSALNHPNIAMVHDYGETAEGQPFIVMEFVKGKSLSDLLDEGLTLKRSVEIVSSIAEALGEAHDHGIVHRDIKPSNVLISDRGNVKVLDFGLVKHLTDPSGTGVDLDAQTIYSTQTRSDVIVGTPLYLSPEQATGKAIDGRSDLFALGALLYECLTGQSAFSGGSVLEIGAQIIHVTPPPPSKLNPQVTAALDRITLKALEKKVEARYQSAAEMLTDLQAAATGLAGASVNPQWPMTAVVVPCHAEQVPRWSQKIWASMWVCPSMMPGATTRPSASRVSRALSRMRPIDAIFPFFTPMSARKRGRPEPSITTPFLTTRSYAIARSSIRGRGVGA